MKPSLWWIQISLCQCGPTQGAFQKSQLARTSHFDNEIAFFQEFLLKKKHLFHAHILFRI